MGRFIEEIMRKVELKLDRSGIEIVDEELEELRYILNQLLRTNKMEID